MKTGLLVVISLAIVGGGLMWWLGGANDSAHSPQTANSGGSSTSNDPSTAADVEIIYSQDGFSPSAMSIKVGDTVRWVNQSGDEMWVASDDHPEHTDYLGFDQEGVGNSYQFTFDRSGTWGYHNHARHIHEATITVN